jgi:hypothetical protein
MVLVPTLEELRAMTDAQLLQLKTTISYDMGMIESQIRFHADVDPDGVVRDEDWIKRASFAQHRRQHGISTIKNVMMERSAARHLEPAVPLTAWMTILHNVVEAAEQLTVSDAPDGSAEASALWDDLENALDAYRDFTVQTGLIRETIFR